MAKIGNIKDIFSQDTLNAQNQLNQIELAKPGDYQSQYSEKMGQILDQILNKKDFQYDFNADPLYQQYKDNYTQLGKNAMMDTAANAATLTGGFGNSYATTAAAQANQQYMTQINNVIPELYNLAMDKYNMDRQDLYNQYSAVGNQEDRAYGQYRDTVSDWRGDRDYYYGKYSGSVANDQYVSNYNQTEAENERAAAQWQAQLDYQKQQDALAASQWQQQFDYNKQQDAAAYALQLAKANTSKGSSGGSSSGSSSGSKASGKDLSSVFNSAKSLEHAGDTAQRQMIASKANELGLTKAEADKIYDQIKAGYSKYQG